MATTAKNVDSNPVESATQSEVAEVSTDEGVVCGSELWFAEVVGLSHWGIDPQKDTNHISNMDLLVVFVDRVNHKGYLWKQCKSQKVKERMQELYKPVFQATAMPMDEYVCESFTRAVMLEVFYFTNINWAQLREEKWRGKTVKSEEVQVYKGPDGNLTYKAQVLKKFRAEKAHTDSEITQLEDDKRIAEQNVENVCNSVGGAAAKQRFQAKEEVLCKLKNKISMEELDLSHSKKMLDYFKTETPDPKRMNEFKEKIRTIETRIREMKKEYKGFEKVHREGNNNLLFALQNVNLIKEGIKDLNKVLVEKTKTIEFLSNPSRHPMALTPYIFNGESDLEEEDELCRKLCALCARPFPNLNIVLASCRCVYHPWCIMTQSWISRTCATDGCKQDFKAKWM